jgi:hypothetical protein
MGRAWGSGPTADLLDKNVRGEDMFQRKRLISHPLRQSLAFCVVVAAVVGGINLGPSGSQPASGSTGPLVFGAAQAPYPGATAQQAVTRLQSSIGRSLAVVRIYDNWDSVFPSSYTNWLKSTGHSVYLSVRPKRSNGTIIKWADVAAAVPGDALYADMVRWAQNIKAFGGHMYLTFHHEPETQTSAGYGTPAEFVAAWRTFVTVMRSSGVTNAEYSWTVAESNFFVAPTDSRYAPKFYPGDAYVDDIAVDAYNMYCLRTDGHYQQPWRSLQVVLAPLMTFAQAHPAPGLMLAEWGTPEDAKAPGRKAQWFADAQQLFKQPGYQRFKAVLYWNQKSSNFANCDFRVDTSQSALAAFSAMAKDPFYSASVS